MKDPLFSKPLCILMNRSFDEGVFPDVWKLANVRPKFFLLVDLRTLLLYFFWKVGKKNKIQFLKFFLLYPPTLNIICFDEKNNIFLRFCLCIFESDTVKSDCPVQIFRKI